MKAAVQYWIYCLVLSRRRFGVFCHPVVLSSLSAAMVGFVCFVTLRCSVPLFYSMLDLACFVTL